MRTSTATAADLFTDLGVMKGGFFLPPGPSGVVVTQ